jgi:starch synthase
MHLGVGAATTAACSRLALRRALGLWHCWPEEIRKLMVNGMCYDNSWNYPGRHYANIDDYIRHK